LLRKGEPLSRALSPIRGARESKAGEREQCKDAPFFCHHPLLN
jgi:hypothetical protein